MTEGVRSICRGLCVLSHGGRAWHALILPVLCAPCPCSAYVYKHRITPFWIGWEVALIALMWTASAIYVVYAQRMDTQRHYLNLGFDAYDALSSAPARFFLTARKDGEVNVPVLDDFVASATAAVNASTYAAWGSGGDGGNGTTPVRRSMQGGVPVLSASGGGSDDDQWVVLETLAHMAQVLANQTDSTVRPLPAEPLRWRLPEDRRGLEAAALQMAFVQDMYNLYMTYSLLQGIILMFLVVRWLNYVCFQPRLSVISGTIALAMKVGAAAAQDTRC